MTVEPRRDYLSGTLMTQIVGYTGALSPEGYEELDGDQGGHRAEGPDDAEGPDNTEDNEDNLQNGED